MENNTVFHSPEELIDLYSDMVYKIALSQTKNRSDADDVFQETFLGIMRRGRGFDSIEHEKAYLIRTALNACKKFFGSAWHRHRSDLDEAALLAAEPAVSDDEGAVYSAVLALPEKYRTVVHLFYYEQLSVLQIAQILQANENTVKSQLSRARGLLKQALSEGDTP